MSGVRIGARVVARSPVTHALVASALVACSRAPAPAPSTDAASGSAPAIASSAPAAPQGPTTWSGTYDAVAGTLFVPDGGEWSGVKFRGEDASTGLGPGTLTLTIDAKSGRAEGTGEGALGVIVLTGLLQDDTLTAHVAPKDPNDGFSGTAYAKREGDSLKGTIHLSHSTANIIREASFTLAKK